MNRFLRTHHSIPTLATSTSAILASVLAGILAATAGCSKRPGPQAPGAPAVPSAVTAPGAMSAPTATTPASKEAPTTLSTTLAPSALAPEAATPSAPVAPAAPAQTCFTYTYQITGAATRLDEDSFSQHRNLLTLKHTQVNPGSLCVRVNGIPVAFARVKGHSDQITISGVAGPKTRVSTSYCLGKTRCTQDCKIPKDEFMEAIGGADSGAQAGVGQWDNGAADAEDEEAARADKDLRRELAGVSDDPHSLLKDWVIESEGPACAGRS
jgi:hypothetical protein